jgi:hypothetical protein
MKAVQDGAGSASTIVEKMRARNVAGLRSVITDVRKVSVRIVTAQVSVNTTT